MGSLDARLGRLEIIVQGAPRSNWERWWWSGYPSREAMFAAVREAMEAGDEWFEWSTDQFGQTARLYPPYLLLADELEHDEYWRQAARYDELWPVPSEPGGPRNAYRPGPWPGQKPI